MSNCTAHPPPARLAVGPSCPATAGSPPLRVVLARGPVKRTPTIRQGPGPTLSPGRRERTDPTRIPSPPEARMRLAVKVLLGWFALFGLGIGLWQAVFPASFYTDFPGMGHHWV